MNMCRKVIEVLTTKITVYFFFIVFSIFWEINNFVMFRRGDQRLFFQ